MKRSFSLRTQLFALMALLVLLQSVALIAALSISRVFLMLDAEAFRLFENTTNTRAQTYNTNVGDLVSSLKTHTEALSSALNRYAASSGTQEAAFYLDDEAYLQAASLGTDTLLDLLDENYISGAFLLLEGSNADKQNPDAHSAVYLRNSAEMQDRGSVSNYLLEVGPISISQQHKLSTSINWRLDMALPAADDRAALLQRPMQAVRDLPDAEIERYGYWTTPTAVLDDGKQVATYTMPLIGRDGQPYGVLGIELSLTLISQRYLPNTDLPYQNSFYAISPVSADEISLIWYIPSGPLAQVYLRQTDGLPLQPVDGTGLYETRIDGLGAMYCTIEPLVMYSRNSPFYEDSWSLVGYVPQEVLNETSASVRDTLLASIGLTTAFVFVLLFVLLFLTTRRVTGLSAYVRQLSPSADIRFNRTGIREIDELMGAVEKLNRSVMNASKTTSKILELTLMPLGGYEVSEDSGLVVLTEYVYRLLGIPSGTEIDRQAWAKIHAQLVEHPARGYDNIYNYTDPDGNDRWLRILEAPTEGGHVGIVLDVSHDIEEHRRLAHELDYDALTHLYSRTAFKREAFRMIREAPEAIGAMVFIDLDNLKYMNDTYGHDLGDHLIIRAGEMFRLAEADGAIVSRISGDEFAIYIHGYDSREEIKRIIRSLFDSSSEYSFRTPDGQVQRIRFSAGIAYYPADSRDVTDLLKLSDYAMYEAKHNKKGALFEFNRESYSENLYLLENREAINLLLDEGLIRFAFQPITDLRTGEIYAYEALMRPLLDNFKSPLEILTVAASQSKLGQLERLVLLTAFQTVRESAGELRGRKVFVNSIPSQFLSDEDLLTLERNYSDLFGQIVVEITEAENDSPEHFNRKLAFARKNGLMIAVDDYGSGYSNEIRVLSMNPDIVKVDIEMISGIDQNADKQKLLSNLLSFCRPKGIRVVAEGVERSEELAQLIRMGVDLVQGYYIARPAFEFRTVPEEIVEEILRLNAEMA